MICLIGCKCFSVVTYHANFTSLSIQPCNKLPGWQVHCVEPATDAICPMYEHPLLLKDMFIRPTLCLATLIIHPDDIHLRMPVEMFALWWMVEYLICVIKTMILYFGTINGYCFR